MKKLILPISFSILLLIIGCSKNDTPKVVTKESPGAMHEYTTIIPGTKEKLDDANKKNDTNLKNNEDLK